MRESVLTEFWILMIAFAAYSARMGRHARDEIRQGSDALTSILTLVGGIVTPGVLMVAAFPDYWTAGILAALAVIPDRWGMKLIPRKWIREAELRRAAEETPTLPEPAPLRDRMPDAKE